MDIYHFDKETFNLLLSTSAVGGTLYHSTMLWAVLCSSSAKLQSPPQVSLISRPVTLVWAAKGYEFEGRTGNNLNSCIFLKA